MDYLVRPPLPKFKSGLEDLVDKLVNRGIKNRNPFSMIKRLYSNIVDRLNPYLK
ncbi:MAG: hypothetical protein OH319_04505 [Candidatus Parvarchaeota archaeon]|nr:hypothetical protein [Candidatus Jingweiarchaeum tengchongense]MCW1297900.1 hypothetical protein [Candidatus Jingweiarchaeum tengchongense]MCW1300666.1 hypothetical protein [Candidatus Jingweiarchaeum tengchongense]MCW1304660.1 hypothetical protein [Candidatus Jingweiarchaeum tengchongense]MCW1305849.1 hypothetical protein [Candidatus Jingweiarchaeum tengchongense]